ncbi:UNKNOWN [Stylonychia lemnae]|uniref:Uncharacterized protein n=1 Tax=Stylonychia lemnae TaxID=5949 RepID=A0A078A967_STYLE|nr:UNKNOWN [Stylonychia lemnae]|eukprot:CDW78112.1 UNKNOWN [Stylonychia lemnae]
MSNLITLKVKRNIQKYKKQHSLYQTKKEFQNKQLINQTEQPYNSRNVQTLKLQTNSKEQTEYMSMEKDHNQDSPTINLQESIIIQKVERQINPITLQTKHKKAKDSRGKDLEAFVNNSQERKINSLGNSNDKGKRIEKHIELNMTDVAILETQNIRKNLSDNSGVNQINSELQSPHSAQDHNSFLLRPRGLVIIQDSHKITHNNIPIIMEKQHPNQQSHNNPKTEMGKFIQGLHEIQQQILTFRSKSDASELQRELNNLKQNVDHSDNLLKLQHQSRLQRRKSYNNDVNLTSLLDVKPLEVINNIPKGTFNNQTLNKNALINENSQQPSNDISMANLGKLNTDILQVRVEQKQSKNLEKSSTIKLKQFANTNKLSNDNILSLTSNQLTTLNNHLLPIALAANISRAQMQMSVNNTPPEWGAVYQHNPSNLGQIGNYDQNQSSLPKQSSKSFRESENLRLTASQHIVQRTNRTKKTKQIMSEIKLNKMPISGLEQIDAKTLKLDGKTGNTSNQYHISSGKIIGENAYYEITPRKQTQVYRQISNTGEQRELVYSVKKQINQDESENQLSQRNLKNTCVGTDELENLMNEDQISSQISNLQIGRNHISINHNIIQKGGGNIQDNYGNNSNSFGIEHNHVDLNRTYNNFQRTQDSIFNEKFSYGSPIRQSNLINQIKAQNADSSRIIIKNILGRNKIMVVSNTGNSFDEDVVKELKQERLRISGDQIYPMNTLFNTQSNFNSFKMEPRFPKEMQDQALKVGSSFFERSLVKTKDDRNADESVIYQDYQLSQKLQFSDIKQQDSLRMNNETLRSYNPYDNESSQAVQSQLMLNPSNNNTSIRLENQKQNAVLQNSTPMTEHLITKKPRNQSQVTNHPKSLVPTVHITSSNYKAPVNTNAFGQQTLYEKLQINNQEQELNQRLRSAPKIDQNVKTIIELKSQRKRQIQRIGQQYSNKDDSMDVQTLRGPSNDQDDQQSYDLNYQNSSIAARMEDKKYSPILSKSPLKGLIYKISKEFTEALNRHSIHSRDQVLKGPKKIQIKSQDHDQLKKVLEKKDYIKILEQPQIAQSNMQIRQTFMESTGNSRERNLLIEKLNLSGLGESQVSTINGASKNESLKMSKIMRKTNGFGSQSNQIQFAAIEKKIFRKERILNNVDKNILEMQAYPFIIPSQGNAQSLLTKQDETIESNFFHELAQKTMTYQSRQQAQGGTTQQFFTKRHEKQRLASNQGLNYSLIQRGKTVNQILKKTRRNLSTVISHQRDGIIII